MKKPHVYVTPPFEPPPELMALQTLAGRRLCAEHGWHEEPECPVCRNLLEIENIQRTVTFTFDGLFSRQVK